MIERSDPPGESSEGALPTVDAWADDLFNRREEATLLTDYIESIAARPPLTQDSSAHTIAVDAGYGEGKTFFLRRLARSLEGKHPVAFVDAWADDLADEPLSALVATLQSALAPMIQASDHVRSRWVAVLDKTGAVAKIAGKGLLKRGLGLLFTSAAVEAADEVLSGADAEVKKEVDDAIKESVSEAIDGAVTPKIGVGTHVWMQQRIDDFQSGKQAIFELKRELSSLVEALRDQPQHPPIIIIIDELDRCRPSYSVKLLEEIKHLFDVPELVFILGMHGEQLSKSISGTYGADFDGKAYLRRFVNRRYRLRTPDLAPLLNQLLGRSGVPLERLVFPPIRLRNSRIESLPPHVLIASYMNAFGLTARDAVQFIDLLQTSAALTQRAPLLMAYLAPLIISRVLGAEAGVLIEPTGDYQDLELVISQEYPNPTSTSGMWPLAKNIQAISNLSERDVVNRVNQRGSDSVAMMVLNMTMNGQTSNNPFAHPRRYPQLLEAVGRFENPQIKDDELGH